MKLNNTPPPDVTTVQITDERLTFGLEDGRTVSVPLSFYPTLQLATRRERADFEISHTSWRRRAFAPDAQGKLFSVYSQTFCPISTSADVYWVR